VNLNSEQKLFRIHITRSIECSLVKLAKYQAPGPKFVYKQDADFGARFQKEKYLIGREFQVQVGAVLKFKWHQFAFFFNSNIDVIFHHFFGILHIIGTALRIYIGDFLIKPSFAAPDVGNAGKLFFKIIFTKNVNWVFRRSSSMVNPLMMYSFSLSVAQIRNWVA
jgi:hypothetical protein